MITLQDKEVLSKKGISEEQVDEQLSAFKKGFPYIKLYAAATTENGIVNLNKDQQDDYSDAWNKYLQHDVDIVKFVPASGAASRMFKNLFEFLDASYSIPQTDFEKFFFEKIEGFAFFKDLNECCLKNEHKDIFELLKNQEYKTIIKNLLLERGLNYGQLPKGLLKFHTYNANARTPFEEHLVEGALYAANKRKEVNIHFTVSSEHKVLFEQLANKMIPEYSNKFGVNYHVSFSEQKSSTDTIAVDLNNQPFRVNGKLFFRPGGHGALIENLNEINSDIIFIKNIDNVVPDRLKEETTKYKKILAGVLVSLQEQIFDYLKLLDSGKYSHEQVLEILQFVQKNLFCRNPEVKMLEDSELVIYLRHKLDRPIRVCGMVKNVGEPGGGPFFTYNSDGTISLQILESVQVDKTNQVSMDILEKSTHFNPVDIVCGIKNYAGEKYDLTKYVDKSTGFISLKSKNGMQLKALELPGLWNGAMSDWNTIFVEVPLTTFNPVKTVNDLLRDQHQ